MLDELQSHRDCIGARYGTNPQHIKGLNGHKTDPKDAQWIAELLETGKLKGSMPNRNIKVSSVATDLFGVSGRRMLRAVVEGKHDAG